MRQLDKELANLIHQAIQNAQTAGELPKFEIPAIEVTRPKRKGQGDLSYPAMQLAKLARKNPLDIANLIQAHLPNLPAFDRIEVAPPGFINCFLSKNYLKQQAKGIAESNIMREQLFQQTSTIAEQIDKIIKQQFPQSSAITEQIDKIIKQQFPQSSTIAEQIDKIIKQQFPQSSAITEQIDKIIKQSSRQTFEIPDIEPIINLDPINAYLTKWDNNLAKQFEKTRRQIKRYFPLHIGADKTAQVEFVSANPSGPITIGHARNAVVGDAMARLLEAAGYEVQREYYYNNAGVQMTILGKSLMLRYLQQLGKTPDFPTDYYQGDYLIDIAKELVEEHGDSLKDKSWERFKEIAEARMFDWIKQSLAAIDIHHDAFFNETSLFESEEIWRVLETLRGTGYIYESPYREDASEEEIAEVTAKGYQPATWFRSSRLGDEKDRVMVKSDGAPTYTLPDIAYHLDKLKRGFDIAVNVLGSDHFTQAAVVRHGIRALDMNPEPIHVIFIQMVRAVRWNAAAGDYETVKQSKRAGNFDTLDELVEMTSADAVRYHMLARSPNSQLDFDVDAVVKQSNENPVYYIQNAHVRCAGILREAAARGLRDNNADLSLLSTEELEFLNKTLDLKNVIEQAVTAYEPHKIAFFAHDLASAFHPIYDRVRVLHSEVPEDVAKARLRFYRDTKTVFGYLLWLMGMSAPERM